MPEVTGMLWEFLGEVLGPGRRPGGQVLTVLSDLTIKTLLIVDINVLHNVL